MLCGKWQGYRRGSELIRALSLKLFLFPPIITSQRCHRIWSLAPMILVLGGSLKILANALGESFYTLGTIHTLTVLVKLSETMLPGIQAPSSAFSSEEACPKDVPP